MNCSWCHKLIEDGIHHKGMDGEWFHPECTKLIWAVKDAKRIMDHWEQQKRALHPDDDPFSSEAGQQILLEYRRLNRLALAKLDAGNRLRLMLGQPLLNSTL